MQLKRDKNRILFLSSSIVLGTFFLSACWEARTSALHSKTASTSHYRNVLDNPGSTCSVELTDALALTLAKRLWARLVGEYPAGSDTTITSLADLIRNKRFLEAAEIAVEQKGFVDHTLFSFAEKFTAPNGEPNGTLTAAVALFLGVGRYNRSIKDLFMDGLYVGKQSLGLAAIPRLDEVHWAQFQSAGFSPFESLEIQGAPQWPQIVNSTNVKAGYTGGFAGILTTSSWAEDVLMAGTNRRPVEKLFRLLCQGTLDENKTYLAGDTWVGRDVDRSDGEAFRTNCVGCHGALDGIRGAFAYQDLVIKGGRFVLTFSDLVSAKYSQNSGVFPDGHITIDDRFVNLYTSPTLNARFGWNRPPQGKGIQDLAALLYTSDAFPSCMAWTAYEQISGTDLEQPENLTIKTDLSSWILNMQNNETVTFKKIFSRIAAALLETTCQGGGS